MNTYSSTNVVKHITFPFPDQKMGTSGLRKRVKIITYSDDELPAIDEQYRKRVENKYPHLNQYLKNFFAACIIYLNEWIVNCSLGLDGTEDVQIEEWRLLVGGDGRYLNTEMIQLLIEMLYAFYIQNVQPSDVKPFRIFVGQHGIMSTPACSHFIRNLDCNLGGIIFTASHNPGGPQGDFGVKYNNQHGAPASERITNRIYEFTKDLKEYTDMDGEFPKIDLSQINSYSFGTNNNFIVQIIDPVSSYIILLRDIFDFDMIKSFLKEKQDFSFVFDSLHAVCGAYSRKLFVDYLGMKEFTQVTFQNEEVLEDFGGLHPDPNLVYAKSLVDSMFNKNSHHQMGAASDGDGDRNMILGKQFFVTPSDSLAIIADYAEKCIPYFKNGLKGVARSMPTSTSVDRVAVAKNLSCYEVPTGWKFFGNLMDSGRISICGEESFGTGSDHIREKDGLFSVLAWLSIISYENLNQTDNKFVSIQDIVQNHWKKYGRSFYARYDYEEVDSEAAESIMMHLRKLILGNIGDVFPNHSFGHCEEFSYIDPHDGSEIYNQGIILRFTDGSRIVFRLSGTGSSGATIRVYFEKYVPYSQENHEMIMNESSQNAILELAKIGLEISKLKEFTKREAPTVIT